MNPLHDEIDRLALKAAADAPPADLARLRRRAARRRTTRVAVLTTAAFALVAGTGWAASRLGGELPLEPAPPGPSTSSPPALSAPPECGGPHGGTIDTRELRPVEVSTSTRGEVVVLDVGAAPAITSQVVVTDDPWPEAPEGGSLGALDAEGPVLILGRGDGTIIGFSTLVDAPGARDLAYGAELSYTGYGPFLPCPDSPRSPDGSVPPGLYSVNVVARWTTPEGTSESSARSGGMVTLTSPDEQLDPDPTSSVTG